MGKIEIEINQGETGTIGGIHIEDLDFLTAYGALKFAEMQLERKILTKYINADTGERVA